MMRIYPGDRVTFLDDIETWEGLRRVKGEKSRVIKVSRSRNNVPFIVVRDPDHYDHPLVFSLKEASEKLEIEYGGQKFFDRYNHPWD